MTEQQENFWIAIAGIIFIVCFIWVVASVSDWAERSGDVRDSYYTKDF